MVLSACNLTERYCALHQLNVSVVYADTVDTARGGWCRRRRNARDSAAQGPQLSVYAESGSHALVSHACHVDGRLGSYSAGILDIK